MREENNGTGNRKGGLEKFRERQQTGNNKDPKINTRRGKRERERENS